MFNKAIGYNWEPDNQLEIILHLCVVLQPVGLP